MKRLAILLPLLVAFLSPRAESLREFLAHEEFEAAVHLPGEARRGKEIYTYCVACHGPEGWGTVDGSYPQIAGQLPSVIIKQLADIRAGNRDNPLMRAFTSRRILSGPQEIADVAAYISALRMTPYNARGPQELAPWGAEIYRRECAECHGEQGEGDSEEHVPALAGQHYPYLVRQFEEIRAGRRRNADRKMVRQIQRFSREEVLAVMAYCASLRPPPERLAPAGWTNPDFPSRRLP